MAIVDKPTDLFNTLLYSGNNTNNTSITGVGFEPDLTWIKNRNSSGNNCLFTQMTGLDVAGYLASNSANAFASDATLFKSFNSDGYTVGTGGNVNDSGRTYCSWNWLGANGTSSNTTGSIDSTVSANTTAGFSIVKYTGNATVSTIGHGLGVAPKMIITKNISRSDAWPVDCRQGNNGAGGIMYLNETGTLGAYGNSSPYPSTAPTSSVYSVGTAGNTNYNGSTLIAYCFAEKTGFSRFGQYFGNSSDDGTFVYTGFKPALIIVKRADTGAGNWVMQDNKRSSSGGFNENSYSIKSNTNAAEVTNESEVDFVSNGYKFRNALTDNNAAGSKYIYMAFAENPFVSSSGVPGLAR